MAKIDYEFKARVLEEHKDILRLQKKFSREVFLDGCIKDYDRTQLAKYQSIVDALHNDEDAWKIWQECEKINHATYKRNKRLKDTIESMLCDYECFFLTLTFTDDTMQRNSAESRRKYVRRFLSEVSEQYVANIDFGEKNGREHYHAVCGADSLIDHKAWIYGNIDFKHVRTPNDYVALGKYIGKLTNHAIKNTTRGTRIIYSRKSKIKG